MMTALNLQEEYCQLTKTHRFLLVKKNVLLKLFSLQLCIFFFHEMMKIHKDIYSA